MNDDVVLQVEGVGKRFRLYTSPWRRAQEWLSLGQRVCHTDFWAVRNVSFALRRGESFGIIGVNGAGKSTLLKMISGVLSPTEGGYQAHERVLSLLELGIGQNDALTGRENVIVSAQLMGFPDDYAQQRMAQIAEFAELGDFFDRPVATYSTGMRMRLAFSLFAFLECDVLILDEVMAVGDIFFQQKCYARLEELLAQKTAIILVTHDLNAIQQYCEEVMVLHQGNKIFQGRPDAAIQTYVQVQGTRTAKAIEMTVKPSNPTRSDFHKLRRPFAWPPDEAFFLLPASAKPCGKHARFTRVALCNELGQPCQAFKQGETAIFYYEFVLDKDIGVPVGSIEITNPYNLLLHSKTTLQHQMEAPAHAPAGSLVRFRQSMQLNLAPGEYVFSLGLLAIHPDEYARLDELSQEQLNQKTVWACRVAQAGAFVVTAGLGRRMAVLHGGLCDLPGDCQVQVVEPEQGAEIAYATDALVYD